MAAGAPTGLEFLEPRDIAFVEVKGVVLDHATGAPISGANVRAIWKGATYGFHSTAYHCLRVDAARTRPDGSFSIVTPANAVWRKGMAQQNVDVQVHGTGMQERLDPGEMYRRMKVVPDARSTLKKLSGPKEIALSMEVRLIAATQDGADRLRTLQALAQEPVEHCETRGNAGEIKLYLEGIAAEARSLATTAYGRTLAEDIASCARMGSCPPTASTRPFTPDPADPDSRGNGDMTPLMQAASSGDVRSTQAMLAAGANPNRTRDPYDLIGGDSALTLAIQGLATARANRADASRYAEVIKALLGDPRTNVNLRNRVVDLTPLMKALYLMQDDVVGWLLAAGADVNAVAYNGRYTALGIALQAMNTRMAAKPLPAAANQLELLLASKGLEIDRSMGDFGATGLTQALQQGESDIARRLLEAGANPNAPDRSKRTPLVASTQASIINPQHPKFVDGVRLMSAWPGVDFTQRYEGKTALEMARAASRADLVAILEKGPAR